MRVAKELRRSAVFGEVELFVSFGCRRARPISMRVAKELPTLCSVCGEVELFVPLVAAVPPHFDACPQRNCDALQCLAKLNYLFLWLPPCRLFRCVSQGMRRSAVFGEVELFVPLVAAPAANFDAVSAKGIATALQCLAKLNYLFLWLPPWPPISMRVPQRNCDASGQCLAKLNYFVPFGCRRAAHFDACPQRNCDALQCLAKLNYLVPLVCRPCRLFRCVFRKGNCDALQCLAEG